MQTFKSKKILALSSILLIFIDQLSKYIIRTSSGFYICNKGIAFGVVLPSWLILLAIIAIISLIGLLILNLKFEIFNELRITKFINFKLNSNLKFQSASWRTNYPLILILSGAISNLIDRLYYGCVIDFIDFRVWPASIASLARSSYAVASERSIAGWPVFNLADIFICTGALFLLIKLNEK